MEELIPATIITGYLGAGKTTLVNHILEDLADKRIAIIVNELGEVGIDDRLIGNLVNGVMKLTKGCICCAAKNASEQALKEIAKLSREEKKIDRLIIETTGFASPAAILQMLRLNRDLRLAYEVDSVVCVVDSQNAPLYFSKSLESREQVSSSDLAVISKKGDLSQIADLVAGLNPTCEILKWEEISPSRLLNRWTFREPAGLENPIHSHSHDEEIGAVVLETMRKISKEDLFVWLDENVRSLGASLLRCKGIVDVGGGRRLVVQGVRLSFETEERGEKENEPSGTTLVVIGLSLDGDSLKKSFAQIPSR